MFRRVLVLAASACLLAALAVPAVAQSPASVSGRWQGAIAIMGQELQIAVVFSGEGDGLKASIDIPQQGAKGLPLSAVRLDGAKVHFELAAGPGLAKFDGDVKGDRMTGTFEQATAKGTFDLTRGNGTNPTPSPEPPPPYKQEEVTIQSGAVSLAGTLTMPQSGPPHPAVVLITGSGPQNRDEEVFGFKPFKLLADHLTRAGLAVLRCDDRGVGGSTGSTTQSTSSDFADDVLAEVKFLQGRSDIDRARIGVLGHSEGGIVGPLAASRSKDIAFVVLMSGPALTGEKIMIAQGELIGRAEGVPDEQVRANVALQRKLFDSVRTGQGWDDAAAAVRTAVRSSLEKLPEAQRQALGDLDKAAAQRASAQLASVRTPWFKYFLDYDPAATLAKVTCPVLAVFGELDLQVPTEVNRLAMEDVFRRANRRDATIRVIPRANHLYQEAKTGGVSEYLTLPKAFAPGFLDTVTTWIQQHTTR